MAFLGCHPGTWASLAGDQLNTYYANFTEIQHQSKAICFHVSPVTFRKATLRLDLLASISLWDTVVTQRQEEGTTVLGGAGSGI